MLIEILTAAAVASAAEVSPQNVAPISPPAMISNPSFEQRPTGAQVAQGYPQRALNMEKNGDVLLRCTVKADGAVSDCLVASETPAGFEFGAAALKLSAHFRVKPTSAGGESALGAIVEFPIKFRVN